MYNIKINQNPSTDSLESFISALKMEFNEETGIGFWGNRHILRESRNNDLLLGFESDDKLIGIIDWSEPYDKVGKINIFAVHPEYRKQGIGKQMIDLSLPFFKNAGCDTLNIFCKPLTSIPFWEKMGFIKDEENLNGRYEMYIHL